MKIAPALRHSSEPPLIKASKVPSDQRAKNGGNTRPALPTRPITLNSHPGEVPVVCANASIKPIDGQQIDKKVTLKKSETKENEPELRNRTFDNFKLVREAENCAFQVFGQNEKLSRIEEAQARQRFHQSTSLLEGKQPFLDLLDIRTGGFRDESTGLYCELHSYTVIVDEVTQTKDVRYVLVFPGTGAAGMDSIQWKNNLRQLIDGKRVNPLYQQAAALVGALKEQLGADNLELAGYSLGGGLANYAGLKHSVKSTCFNAAALGQGCLKDINNVTQEQLNQQTHIRVKGDLLSSTKTLSKIRKFFPAIFRYAPRQVGTIWTVPAAPGTKALDRHRSSYFEQWYHSQKQEKPRNDSLTTEQSLL